MGKYWQGPRDDKWHLYDDDWNGEAKLIHRWKDDYEQGTIHCPDCDIPLMFKNCKAACQNCGEEFTSGRGKVFRVKALWHIREETTPSTLSGQEVVRALTGLNSATSESVPTAYSLARAIAKC